MSLLSYKLCYIRVKRLFSLLDNHVQQTAHLEDILSTSDGCSEHQPHSFTNTYNNGSISLHLLFSVLCIELSIYGHPGI